MKKNIFASIAVALLIAALPAAAQVTYSSFVDTFTNGSTIDSLTPAKPTTNSAAYQQIAAKTFLPNPPTITANSFKCGIGSSSSGCFEEESVFTTTPVALSQPNNDFIQLTIVFTNTSGILVNPGYLLIGLFNSGGVGPLPGGTNNATTAVNLTGSAQNWLGYNAQLGQGSFNSKILTRTANSSVTTANNQDVLVDGLSSSEGYTGSSQIGSSVIANLTLAVGATYTESLNIALVGQNSLAITNNLYSGAVASGTPLASVGGVATNSTYLTGGFDSLAIGFLSKSATTLSNVVTISSISVTSAVTVISAPPTITLQPNPVAVVSGGCCAMDVSAIGFGVQYQWYRNGAALADVGNISGATSSQLVISPAGPGDVFSGANGYYCKVSGTGGFTTNSVTNALSLISSKTLTWTAAGGNTWDVANTVSWNDPSLNPVVFNFGDPVILDDTAGNEVVNLSGSFISPASVSITTANAYTLQGGGSLAGPMSLAFNGSGSPGSPGELILNCNNTYSGGTTISNVTFVQVKNYNGFGTGPVNLNDDGGTMELVNAGSATAGIQGTLNINSNYTVQVDGAGTFGAVFLGDLAGSSTATLTIQNNPGNPSVTNRIRVYGNNTTNNANIFLNGPSTPQAQYYGMVLSPYESGIQVYNGVISGSGGVVNRGGGQAIFTAQNTYTGGTVPTAGSLGIGADSTGPGASTSGPIGTGDLIVAPETGSANGTGTIFAYGGAHTIANPVIFPANTNNQTLATSGSNILTLSGTIDLNGADGIAATPPLTNRTFSIGSTVPTIFSGVISDDGQAIGLTKSGTGTLELDNTETYTGPTTVSAGLLNGNGSLAGSVLVATNAAIGGGTAASLGTLTVSGGLNFTNGGGFFRVNRSGLASDHVSVGGALTNSGTVGTITVTNLGATLQVGDSFTLFNKGVSNGAALTVIGGNVAWGNNLALNGSIVVVTPPDTGILLAAPASVLPGGNITNTITVTNFGPGTALALVITDTVPSNVTFVSANSGGTTNGHLGVVVWNLSSLAANTGTNFTLIFNAPTAGLTTNTATVVSSSVDTNPGNNSATTVTAIISTIVPTVPPHIGTFSLAGANLVINATNGVTGGTYYLLGTTNLTKPLSQWTALATNVVTASGGANAFTFTGTNVVIPGTAQQFYLLSSTNN